VLRQRWSGFLKIIDFGFSNVDHTCPGWRECGELKAARDTLGLDRVNFRLKSWVGEKFRIRSVAGIDLFKVVFTLLIFIISVIMSGILGNWGMSPQIRRYLNL
jgi:hypothetical protein